MTASPKSARVIVLNGTGSVGKSSTAKALQAITETPFLHVQMDTFLEMLPAAMFGHPDGYSFETVQDQGRPSVIIRTGPVMEQTMRGMRHAIAAMAAQGADLIVDDVMFCGAEQRVYRDLLAPFETYFVGLFAPLEVLEARESARGDRDIGLARWQYERVHAGLSYDLEIDTTLASPAECAEKIKAAFGL
jgi:chloramphenicol 3-O phosphotransferase